MPTNNGPRTKLGYENVYDRRVLPSVGPLCGIPPWYRFVILVGERDRLLNWDRLETSGLLCGDISGEVDHQWLGFALLNISGHPHDRHKLHWGCTIKGREIGRSSRDSPLPSGW